MNNLNIFNKKQFNRINEIILEDRKFCDGTYITLINHKGKIWKFVGYYIMDNKTIEINLLDINDIKMIYDISKMKTIKVDNMFYIVGKKMG